MATYYARATGNINGAIWSTTPSGTASSLFSSFTNADTLMSNSFTVTVNVDTTVLEIRNDTTGGATTGGSFSLNNGVTLTANIYSATTVCLNITGSTSANIIGNIYGTSTTTNTSTVTLNTSGTVNITGNITNTNFTNSATVIIYSSGIVNIVGNITGGGGNSFATIYVSNTGTVNITGIITGGSGSVNTFGVQNLNVGTVNITGTVVGGVSVPGASNSSTGTMTITRAKGNGYGNGSVGLNSIVGIASSQNSLTRVYEIEYGDLGQSPTSGPISFVNDTSNKALFYRPSLSKKTLVDSAASLDLPTANNVRSGITYNFGSNTGTCIIPSANSVAFGVAVDNSTGTATLTPQSIWDILTTNINTNNSIGERLKNSATIDSVASQVITIKGN